MDAEPPHSRDFKTTGTHTGIVGDKAVIVDTVELGNLTVGDSYKVVGTIMTSEGNEFLVDGNAVTAESGIFKADEKNVTVKITFPEFDATLLAGKSLVVFEKLYYVSADGSKTVEVSRHEDKDDLGQTISYPELHTNASDGQTKDQSGTVGETTVVDLVTYKNLVFGTDEEGKPITYKVTGTLIVKETGEALKDADGNVISKTVEFTPEAADGTVKVEFTVDTTRTDLEGQT